MSDMLQSQHIARTDRMREPICPPWCRGHSATFQPWEKHDDDGHLRRDHENEPVDVSVVEPRGHVQVSIDAVELEPGHLAYVRVGLYVGNETVELTPVQSLQLASRQVSQAEQALEFIA